MRCIDDMHGVAVIGFANPLPLKDLAVFLFCSHSRGGIVKNLPRFYFGLYMRILSIVFRFPEENKSQIHQFQ